MPSVVINHFPFPQVDISSDKIPALHATVFIQNFEIFDAGANKLIDELKINKVIKELKMANYVNEYISHFLV